MALLKFVDRNTIFIERDDRWFTSLARMVDDAGYTAHSKASEAALPLNQEGHGLLRRSGIALGLWFPPVEDALHGVDDLGEFLVELLDLAAELLLGLGCLLS